MRIFIPGNTPSSKNSRVYTGKFFITSKQTRNYIKETEHHWIEHGAVFRQEFDRLPKPVSISFKFIRKSKHKFDYINPAQTVQDLMTKYGWIPDDNCEEMIPVFEEYEYDKENPGTYIEILKN